MNSRNIIGTHWDEERWRSCPACQYAIDQDHAEALLEEDSRELAFTQADFPIN